MNINDAIAQRHSCRAYTKKATEASFYKSSRILSMYLLMTYNHYQSSNGTTFALVYNSRFQIQFWHPK
jgi:hypothetical protein